MKKAAQKAFSEIWDAHWDSVQEMLESRACLGEISGLNCYKK